MTDGLQALRSCSPHEVLVWSGAGISIDAPTCGPAGRALTDRALARYFLPETAGRLTALYDRLSAPHAEARPRLETVLDALFEVYGSAGLRDVLSDLVDPTPNRHHLAFAAHALAGGSHVTTNFDTCIERAAPRGALSADRVLHVHGAIDASGDVEPLGARLSVIEHGLPSATVATLDRLLDSPTFRALFVVGYSGSDFFDVTPYISSRLDQLRGKTVVWHEYNPAAPEHPYLAQFREAGALVHRLEGRLDSPLATLASSWGLSPLPHPAGGVYRPPWTSRTPDDAGQREAATVALYARMGYRTGVRELLGDATRPLTRVELDRLADAEWGAGRYRAAWRAWQQAYDHDSDDDRMLLDERRGATLWIRGRMLAAERQLWRALQRWVIDSPTDRCTDTQLRLLETYGRVVTHMRRFPDTRWFVRARRVDTVISELHRRRSGPGRNREGLHLRARLDSVENDLQRTPDPRREAHITAFEESEALHSWLNYEHGKLRRQVEQPVPGDRPGAPEKGFQTLIDRQKIIGAYGDAARVLLIPGAPRFSSPRTFVTLWRPVDVAPWHRPRLTAGFTLRWLISLA